MSPLLDVQKKFFESSKLTTQLTPYKVMTYGKYFKFTPTENTKSFFMRAIKQKNTLSN